jgi:hypothetical protein
VKSLHKLIPKLNPFAFDAIKSSAVQPVKESRQFFHSGDLGDIIYALPAIKALGGGTLFIGPTDLWQTRQKLTAKIVENLKPLLLLQPYINDVVYTDTKPVDALDLNRFREYLIAEGEFMQGGKRRLNLAEAHLYVTKLPLEKCSQAWLTVDRADKAKDRPIVFARTARWRNDDFPWAKIMNKLGKWAVFVGTSEEHCDFTNHFGYIPHAETPTVLDLARLVYGAYLFVGNQSLPYAIREAVKGTSVIESWANAPNCLFMRETAAYGDKKIVYSPRVEKELMDKCPICEADTTGALVLHADTGMAKCQDCGIILVRKRLNYQQIENYRYFSSLLHLEIDVNRPTSNVPLPPSPINVITRKSLWAEEAHPVRKPMWLARRTQGRETVFYMSGDLGDIVYALPTIRALGGGQLCVGPAKDNSYFCLREPMTRQRFDVLEPLLSAQKAYLSSVWYSDAMNGNRCHVDLNDSRRLHREPYYKAERNLADVPAVFFQLGTGHWRTKWLEAEPKRQARFIFARSLRYPGKDFPWAKLVERYGKDAAFVGVASEHAAFVKQFGQVPFYATANLMEVASVIAGADWFIGNQSSPLAIAEGLKKNCVREHFEGSPNCIFDRDGHTADPSCLLC